jgi:hypothetical protein
MTVMPPDWLDQLAERAPDVVAAYRGIEKERFLSVRHEVRRRAGDGSVDRIVAQLGALAEALAALVASLPEKAFAMPGGDADWTVTEAVGHAATSRAGLVLAASLAASGRWPADAFRVVPGVPGPADADRQALLDRIAVSQRVIVRAVRSVAGHELDPCPLDHPLVGRLRCGEWVLFAGVHDLMHLEQLHRIAAGFAEPAAAAGLAEPTATPALESV